MDYRFHLCPIKLPILEKNLCSLKSHLLLLCLLLCFSFRRSPVRNEAKHPLTNSIVGGMGICRLIRVSDTATLEGDLMLRNGIRIRMSSVPFVGAYGRIVGHVARVRHNDPIIYRIKLDSMSSIVLKTESDFIVMDKPRPYGTK